MYVSPISIRLLGGRSTPAILAMNYPCLCLCFVFTQMTRTTRFRCTILHLSQIFLTDALTFILPPTVFWLRAAALAFAAAHALICTDTRSGRGSDRTVKARQPPCHPEGCE